MQEVTYTLMNDPCLRKNMSMLKGSQLSWRKITSSATFLSFIAEGCRIE
ncbi:hypothetical protein [Cytobacillus praedii]|nr:hypothetical protein [Cytobacillus praedii]